MVGVCRGSGPMARSSLVWNIMRKGRMPAYLSHEASACSGQLYRVIHQVHHEYFSRLISAFLEPS